jgi:hypothetical protein
VHGHAIVVHVPLQRGLDWQRRQLHRGGRVRRGHAFLQPERHLCQHSGLAYLQVSIDLSYQRLEALVFNALNFRQLPAGLHREWDTVHGRGRVPDAD